MSNEEPLEEEIDDNITRLIKALKDRGTHFSKNSVFHALDAIASGVVSFLPSVKSRQPLLDHVRSSSDESTERTQQLSKVELQEFDALLGAFLEILSSEKSHFRLQDNDWDQLKH